MWGMHPILHSSQMSFLFAIQLSNHYKNCSASKLGQSGDKPKRYHRSAFSKLPIGGVSLEFPSCIIYYQYLFIDEHSKKKKKITKMSLGTEIGGDKYFTHGTRSLSFLQSMSQALKCKWFLFCLQLFCRHPVGPWTNYVISLEEKSTCIH